LIELLDEAELRVVLVHEGTHAARRDPLRVLVVKLAAGAAFFLPAARLLEERYLLSLEFAADRRAADASLPHLASALLKLLEAPAGSSIARGAVALSPTEERIRRLTTETDDLPRPQGGLRGYRGVRALTGPVLWTLASGVAAAAVVGMAVELGMSLERCPPTIV
jgi:beta-lactamase regulating signal transducer with metallopeptidase domain